MAGTAMHEKRKPPLDSGHELKAGGAGVYNPAAPEAFVLAVVMGLGERDAWNQQVAAMRVRNSETAKAGRVRRLEYIDAVSKVLATHSITRTYIDLDVSTY